jgi:heme/copper-type cytochrome/quinol oxidase subunit 1
MTTTGGAGGDGLSPRAAGQRTDVLAHAWDTRPGLIGWLGAVNHKAVGKRYIVTALLFFAVGGVQSLLMRIQLGSPESTFLSPEVYNELFTMHGTTMMFLFAVPITEAVGIYFAPLLVGARDMPFPRVNAFGYWAYLFGGLFLYASFFTGAVPDGGWFAYTPLTELGVLASAQPRLLAARRHVRGDRGDRRRDRDRRAHPQVPCTRAWR